MKLFLNTLIERWKAPTEKWFSGVIKLCLWLSGIAGALLAAPSVMTGFVLSDKINSYCQSIVAAGIVISAICKTSSTEHK